MTDKADAALAAQDAEVDRQILDALAEDATKMAMASAAIGGDVSEWSARHRQAADEAGDLGPEVGDWHPGLPIESEADCGKAIAWLAACRREMNEVERRKQQAIETATKWAHDRLHGVMGLKTRHDGQEAKILDYAQKHPEVFGGRKTAKFPGGSIKQRERQEGYYRRAKGADADALLNWALSEEIASGGKLTTSHLEIVPDLDAIKEYLPYSPGSGEAPPGLEWVSPGVDYSVKTGES